MPTFLAWAYTILPGLVKNYSLPAQVSGNNYGNLVYTDSSPTYIAGSLQRFLTTCSNIFMQINIHFKREILFLLHGDNAQELEANINLICTTPLGMW